MKLTVQILGLRILTSYCSDVFFFLFFFSLYSFLFFFCFCLCFFFFSFRKFPCFFLNYYFFFFLKISIMLTSERKKAFLKKMKANESFLQLGLSHVLRVFDHVCECRVLLKSALHVYQISSLHVSDSLPVGGDVLDGWLSTTSQVTDVPLGS